MRKISTLIVLLFLAGRTFSQPTSNVIIFSEEGEKFWVMVNAVRQNTDAQTNVKISGLNQSAYKFKVVFENNAIPDLDKTIYTDPANPSESTYSIKKNNKNEYIVRIMSTVPIAQAPPPPAGQQVVVYSATPVITTTPVMQTTVTQQTTTTTGTPGDQVNMNMNVGGVGMGVNVNVTGMDMTGTTTTTTTTTTTSGTVNNIPPSTTTVVYVPGYGGPIGCPVPMAPSDYGAAKNSIVSKSFEDSKLTIAKQIIGSNCMTADQVKEIMQLFTFEATKLDFAKYAYTYTYDKGNYFKVNDAFEFESSIDELNGYIGGH